MQATPPSDTTLRPARDCEHKYVFCLGIPLYCLGILLRSGGRRQALPLLHPLPGQVSSPKLMTVWRGPLRHHGDRPTTPHTRTTSTPPPTTPPPPPTTTKQAFRHETSYPKPTEATHGPTRQLRPTTSRAHVPILAIERRYCVMYRDLLAEKSQAAHCCGAAVLDSQVDEPGQRRELAGFD